VIDDPLPGLAEPERSLDELIDEAHEIVETAKDEHRPAKTFLLFSGGNDSTVLADVCVGLADAVVYINTGIGIPDAVEHARETGAYYASTRGLPFLELSPPESYESLVLGRWDGLPGPGAHRYTYQRLKERCVEALLRDHRTYDGERFMLLTGVRRAESRRRMGYSHPVDRKGGQVWVNPLFNWSNEAMRRYRDECELPVNPVSVNLHMSGECMCGAMADQGEPREERAAIRFFYPEFDAYLTSLEDRACAAGASYCEWGVKRPDTNRMDPEIDGQLSIADIDPEWAPLCQSCEFRRAS
jgi:3'-phosphoadenosine 5'-phosphosulfate sulfotransferase (PAPS reductase)/FAD synthetase